MATSEAADPSAGQVRTVADDPVVAVVEETTAPAVSPIEDRWVQVYEGGYENAIQINRGVAAQGSRNDFVTAVAKQLFPGEDWEGNELDVWQKEVWGLIERDTNERIGEGWRFPYWAKAPELFEQFAIRSNSEEGLAKTVGETIWPGETFPPVVDDDDGAVPHETAERWDRLIEDAESALAQKAAS